MVTATHPAADLLAQAAERDRPDPGDITDLVTSIQKVGLLHLPVVTKGGKLVSGLRRVAAMSVLGHKEIECQVATTITEMQSLLQAEWDENACRRNLTPEEAARARARRAEILKPVAEAVKAATQAKPGEGRVGGGKFPPPTKSVGKVRDAAAIGLGYSGRTLDKVDKILAVADDKTQPESVRTVATKALKEINAGRPIEPTYRLVQSAPPVEDPWTERERLLQEQMNDGQTVVVNLHTDAKLIAWAEGRDRYTRIDRKGLWGNPFVLPDDGDRTTVINAYRDCYLPNKPSLNPKELAGKALGCWCSPKSCHGDVLKALADA